MSTLRRWAAGSGPLALAILALLPLLGGHAQGAMADSAAVKRSSSAIAITSDGATLLVVNPDSNSLTLVDTAGPLRHRRDSRLALIRARWPWTMRAAAPTSPTAAATASR